MIFNFIIDENYLAYFILNREMYNESDELMKIKKDLEDDIGYKKIIQQEILNTSIYLKDNNTYDLINELISTNIFKDIYVDYTNESKEVIAIKVLKNLIAEDNEELDNLKEDLWNKYREPYQKLLNVGFYSPIPYLLDKDVLKTINDFKNADEFKRLYNETKEYFNYVKDNWNDKKDLINEYLNKILKIEINTKINVYITHPNTYTGYSFSGNNIAWGHYLGINDPIYNLTYLIHEAMHSIFPFERDEDKEKCNIKHAIIELISDYELQSLLKNKSTLKEGHPYLIDYKKKIYPYWLKYIGLNAEEFNKRLDKDQIDINKLKYEDKDISNLNINEFINFCYQNINR